MQLKEKHKDEVNKKEFVIVYTTVGKKADAVKTAKVIVDEGLAACVNILPGVTSIYEWKGKTVGAKECVLVIKTGKRTLKKLENRLRALSSYETPEFISVDIHYGSKDYLAWIYHNTKK